MSTLRQSMAEYLAVRRALGYKLEQTERFLALRHSEWVITAAGGR